MCWRFCTFRSSLCWSGSSYMFLFGLQLWISPHSQPIAELVLGKIWPRVVFLGAPNTLANHSLPTGSISPQVFYICINWLYPPSVQQRRSCLLPCRSLQFSLLPGRKHSSCVSCQVFPFLFCKHCKTLGKLDDFVGNLHV